MSRAASLSCGRKDRRHQLLGNPDWNGLDFLEVAADQLSLCVHFFGEVPAGITPDNVRIYGGRRIRHIRVVNVEIDRAHDPELDDCLRISLDRPGDFSTYRLCLVPTAPPIDVDVASAAAARASLAGIDPRYSCLDFTFKVDCPSDLDCKQEPVCPPAETATPEINYLAKDYASFRQLIFDRLAVTMPEWKERHVSDLGVTLVELLAYAGDHLSYYQDAVSTEAYLDTARLRISIRRHARLVDYRLHEGSNARAWVTVWTKNDLPPLKANDFFFITGFDGLQAASGNIVRAIDLERVSPDGYEVFEPLMRDPNTDLVFLAAHSEMRFYTWGDTECCLAKGATRATLIDEAEVASEPQGPYPTKPTPQEPPYPSTPSPQEPSYPTKPSPQGPSYSSKPSPQEPPYPATPSQHEPAYPPTTYPQGSPPPAASHRRLLALRPGEVVVFEERLGPTTGLPADADPGKRWAVRLTKVTPSYDGLLRKCVLEIEWAVEDALPFSLCLSSRLPAPDCSWISDVSVARGNVVLVDHGRKVSEGLGPVGTSETSGECACEGSIVESRAVPERFRPTLQFAPLTFAERLVEDTPAVRAIRQDARLALPALTLTEYLAGDESQANGRQWISHYDLLASSADDPDFVVEMDDDGRGHLRFGDGELGRRPDAGTRMQARYRVGIGPAGNVGRESISYLVLREGTLSADEVKPRNPLPAQGGVAPEPTAEAKLFAPFAFKSRRLRAIVADDYAEIAQQHAGLQGAACELRWTGSWYEARVAVDPINGEDPDAQLLVGIKRHLFRYRRMGHDLAVTGARYVPLDVAMEICVLPHFTRGHVKAELLHVFGNRRFTGGRTGLFHPDNLSFGDGVYLSQLVAAAKSVEGVDTVKVRRLGRLHALNADALLSGVLVLDSMEVAQLDGDPNFPENGRLELIMRGGR